MVAVLHPPGVDDLEAAAGFRTGNFEPVDAVDRADVRGKTDPVAR